jgi:hypothetical protein
MVWRSRLRRISTRMHIPLKEKAKRSLENLDLWHGKAAGALEKAAAILYKRSMIPTFA